MILSNFKDYTEAEKKLNLGLKDWFNAKDLNTDSKEFKYWLFVQTVTVY